MRLGIRAREIVAITLLTLLVVASTTATYLVRLSRVVVEGAIEQVELTARQIYAQSRRALARAADTDPRIALRQDADLRALVDQSVGHSPHLLYAMIADRDGVALLHSEPAKEGQLLPERLKVRTWLVGGPVQRFQALYHAGGIYESELLLELDGRRFGSVRLGVSTSLVRQELDGSLLQALGLAAVTLPLAWLMALGLGTLALRPIRTLAREMERFRQGDFATVGALVGEDEVGQLAAQLQLLGRQIEADRVRLLSEKGHLQQVVDHLADGVLFLSGEGRVLFLNRAAEEVVGQALDAARGQSMEELLGPEHPLAVLAARALAQRAGFWNARVPVPGGGGARELLVSLALVADGGEAMGAIVVLKDLESIRTLQSVISYSAKLVALGQLTSGVAHEVKNPLNAMMIHLELLRERLRDASDEVRQSLDVIHGEIGRLDRVVQGFVKFVRPQELNLKPVDLNALVQELASLEEAGWRPAAVRFALDLDPELPAVIGDEEALRQTILNLVLNACQAMPHGGTVAIATARGGAEWAVVRVSDEGVGIPPEELDRIFKLYYTTKPGGSGMGLPLVYRGVQLHDGRIDVASEVGRGTTFTVRLPARERQI